jgi:hypothetical protein
MKNTRAIMESGTSTADFGRGCLETAEGPFKAGGKPVSATGKPDPRPQFQPVSARFPALEEQEVVLTLFAPEAKAVYVAGNFNGWRPASTPLKNTGDGQWVVRLMLRSGQYEYRFVVDRWVEDPRAIRRVVNISGGFNSVLTVPLAVKTSIL